MLEQLLRHGGIAKLDHIKSTRDLKLRAQSCAITLPKDGRQSRFPINFGGDSWNIASNCEWHFRREGNQRRATSSIGLFFKSTCPSPAAASKPPEATQGPWV
jgi:hypothetical protein